MKSFALLSLLTLGSCATTAAVSPYEAAAVHAHAIAMRSGGDSPAPLPVPTLRCGGDKIITHGDGHTSPCPGCPDCANKVSLIESVETPLIQPAVFERIVKVSQQACADGFCSPQVTTGSASGSCDSGSCGVAATNQSTSLRRGPVRKFAGRIREARPVRRVLGRLFRRGCR